MRENEHDNTAPKKRHYECLFSTQKIDKIHITEIVESKQQRLDTLEFPARELVGSVRLRIPLTKVQSDFLTWTFF